MKYAKKNASPRQLLDASIALHEANEKVRAALELLNGQVKVKLLDDYINLSNRLRLESMRLEGDFAVLVADKYGSAAPLFGSKENLGIANEFLAALEKKAAK